MDKKDECFFVLSENGEEKLLFAGREFCRIKYHFKYWKEPKGEQWEINFSSFRTFPGKFEVSGEIPGVGAAKITYFCGRELNIHFSFIPSVAQNIGFYFLGMEFPEDATELRLLPGVYCGYTGLCGTFKFSSVYSEKAELFQLASAVDQKSDSRGTTLTVYQYFTMSFPPAFKNGTAALTLGQEISGDLTVSYCQEDIWDPVHKIREFETAAKPEKMMERYTYNEFLLNWEKYIREPDLWVELGNGMGMFHVGFYNVLTDPKLGGPYGYTLNDRPIRYKELQELLFNPGADKNIRFDYFQDNIHQLEIAWGNGCNTMVAYALYNYGGEWFRRKADAIVKALLEFKNGGFQIADGPLSGAWINAYNADSGCFQDHYGGNQVFLPDQGIVNYFLSKIYLEGFNRAPGIPRNIERNCTEFLLRSEKMHNGFPNAFSPDGNFGYSREGYPYNFPNAPGIAQTALSFIMLYRLTENEENLLEAERIISKYLQPLIEDNKFGFLEYDHRGYCSAGAASVLIALAEYLEVGGGKISETVKHMQEKVFYHLLSFRHERDYFIYRHAHNVDGWHAVAKNCHHFLHGFTRGSLQGEYMLHTRYEYAYALLRTLESNPALPVKTALIDHLNSYTWQQFINPELKKGFGGMTEHVGLRTYVQDTAHLLHSVPLAMILIEKANRREAV
ncbi:MAG: hypothetical protein A2017_09195 [Lentisphaerae bacterium GWF2_44_16]|nr:MAG: hypothetical protein A2017_09195 [Lentisphaerae bacterium GWF2_44_16]